MEIMVDIETLGTDNNAVITSIGAVAFDLSALETVEEILGRPYFHMHLNAHMQQADGRQISAATSMWWMEQNPVAIKTLLDGQKAIAKGISVAAALEAFSIWCSNNKAANIWGNGNTFDNMLLRDIYAQYKVKYPVSFRNDLDFRTLKYLVKTIDPTWKVPYPKYGEFKDTAHVGHVDAACQAYSAQRIWAKLNNKEIV